MRLYSIRNQIESIASKMICHNQKNKKPQEQDTVGKTIPSNGSINENIMTRGRHHRSTRLLVLFYFFYLILEIRFGYFDFARK